MTSWYLLVRSAAGDTAEGPFGLERMNELAAQGRLTAESLVARVGAQAWTRAGDDPELAGLVAATGSMSVAAPVPDAPPTAPKQFAPLDSPGSRYNLAGALTLGWSTMKQQWARLVLCSLVFMGLYIAMQIPGWLAELGVMAGTQAGWGPSTAVSILTFILMNFFNVLLQIFVGLPVAAGFGYCGVQAVRGELKVSDCFQGFRRYWGVLGISVICQLIGGGIMAAALLPGIVGLIVGFTTDSAVAIVIGGILLLTLGVTAMLLFLSIMYLPPLLVVDPRMRAEVLPGSISMAWQLGKGGNNASLLLLALMMGVLMVACVVCLVVPVVLFGMPLMMSCIGAAYVLLTEKIIADPTDRRRVRTLS